MSLPSRKTSRVKSIVTYEGELDEAFAPLAVTLTLEDEIDISRGDMIVHVGNLPKVETNVDAMVVWMDEQPLVPGKQYLFKQGTKIVSGSVTTMRYRVDVNTLKRHDAPTLALNEIGRCQINGTTPFIYDAYQRNKQTGAMIIIDRMSNRTVGAGMIIDRAGSEATVAQWEHEPTAARSERQKTGVTLDERQARFGQRPCTILLTGYSGAGKTSTALALERELFSHGRAAMVLDGQSMRSGISRGLGFSAEERSENLRRGVEVARLFNEAGLICICAFMAPSEEIRQKAALVIGPERFLVVHLDAPLEVCRARDREGLYGAAERGEIANFPGISFSYEAPVNPDLVLPTDTMPVDDCVGQIIDLLRARRVFD